jgi:hypothetical protein
MALADRDHTQVKSLSLSEVVHARPTRSSRQPGSTDSAALLDAYPVGASSIWPLAPPLGTFHDVPSRQRSALAIPSTSRRCVMRCAASFGSGGDERKTTTKSASASFQGAHTIVHALSGWPLLPRGVWSRASLVHTLTRQAECALLRVTLSGTRHYRLFMSAGVLVKDVVLSVRIPNAIKAGGTRPFWGGVLSGIRFTGPRPV